MSGILLPGKPIPQNEVTYAKARSGWNIPQNMDEVVPSPLQIDYWMNRFKQKYGHHSLEIRSQDDYPYNCAGMVFASRRAWISSDHIYKILKEDDYKLIDASSAITGDIVVYEVAGDPSHVGIVYSKVDNLGFRILSKWGDLPEIIHPVEMVPDNLGKPVKYYTDRVIK